MNALIIGLYGIFFMLTGLSGNAGKFVDMVKEDAGGFLPWATSIGVLAVMYEYPLTRRVAQPFILLLIISFIVANFDSLSEEYQRLSQLAKGN